MSKLKSLFSAPSRSATSLMEREQRQRREMRYELNFQLNRRISL
ncbi:hypothetical protein [Celeribacter halophilus]|uniref:Uncharacterized protein n=1 Tax=Celeribacter halophilus TaxID=576117 RepID=A0A1I3TRN6_9RHOB|nr:hypothetical protein [Celeribacter halophilus]PZX10707.1 hypothetical protein LX82_02187 [Celeribacter halophilus]SFJ73455.1 hypothetical protein SAMN04488138_10943 [Celeribacter halophilus]